MEASKIVLIILTIIILGPIVFVGSCMPLTMVSMDGCFNGSCSPFKILLGTLAFPIGFGLAIFVCYKVIKKITKNNSKNAN